MVKNSSITWFEYCRDLILPRRFLLSLQQEQMAWWILILLPVPFSRLILHDHSISQVSAGPVWCKIDFSSFNFIIQAWNCRCKLGHRRGSCMDWGIWNCFLASIREVVSISPWTLPLAEGSFVPEGKPLMVPGSNQIIIFADSAPEYEYSNYFWKLIMGFKELITTER